MHPFDMPREIVDAVTVKQGRPHICDTFDGPRTALVVVDMQNYFMAEGQMACAPGAPDIVPNVNRLAESVRNAGGTVVWIQNTLPAESVRTWSVAHERYTPDKQERRLEGMEKDSFGYELWPDLDVKPGDEFVTKRRYSAFIPGSSDIELVLKDRGIDTLIVTGVATNVCCESTARDAMMLNYRAMMVSDGCATFSDDEHAASLKSFYIYFGDVQTTDEVVARLDASARRNAAE